MFGQFRLNQELPAILLKVTVAMNAMLYGVLMGKPLPILAMRPAKQKSIPLNKMDWNNLNNSQRMVILINILLLGHQTAKWFYGVIINCAWLMLMLKQVSRF